MHLAVDMGNSEAKIALFDDDSLRRIAAISTDRFRDAESAERALRGALSQAGVAAESLLGSAAAVVVPERAAPLREALAAIHVGRDPLFVDRTIRMNIRLGYERPEELGADRIADAAAGYDRVGGAVVVVDLGTATTFNAVDARGVFLGGAIAAGVRTAVERLARRAARLFEAELRFPERAIGRSTEEALRSGALYGAAAMVDGMVERILEELGGGAAVGTGGFAAMICPRTRLVREWDEDLTLKGLRLLSRLNR